MEDFDRRLSSGFIIAIVNGRELGRVRELRFRGGHAGMAQLVSGHAVFGELLIEE